MPRWPGTAVTPLLLALLTAASASRAAQPGYEISLGVVESDNVQRTPNGTHNTIIEQELNVTWHDQSSRLTADVDADLSHLTYIPRAFSDQVIGNLIAQARLNLVDQALFWNFSDNFGQGITDPLAAITPENRENINYFNTGPEALLPVGGENLLDVRANYGKTSYEKSLLDSNRYGGGVGLIHRLSEQTDVSLNLQDQRIEYLYGQLNPDYTSQEAFLHVDAKGSRTTLGADVGYGRVVLPNSTNGNVTARLELTRKLSAGSTMSFSFGREYSDAGAAFQIAQVLNGANLNTQQTVQTTGPFTMVYETGGWNFARNRTSLGISVAHFKDTYVEATNLDDSHTDIAANLSRRLTPTLQATLAGQYTRQNFATTLGSAKLYTGDARLSWQTSRRITMAFDYQYQKRASDLANTGYKENTIWLSIGYGRAAELPPGVAAPPTAHPITY